MKPTFGVLVGGAPLTLAGTPFTVACETDAAGLPTTPWGSASALPQGIEQTHCRFIFLKRHGPSAKLAPDQVNYRANIWLFEHLKVDGVIGTHTVGGIDPDLDVGGLVVPDQLIDYTWGRPSTFDDERRHIDFAQPYDRSLREALLVAMPGNQAEGLSHAFDGVYGITQGPRLETAAEIQRMARDGCSVVGMTGMPEAALARELELAYASLCVVVNPAAGIGAAAEQVDMEALRAASHAGAQTIAGLLSQLQV